MSKISIALVLLLSPIICAGQYAYGFLQEMYFGRQPGARAEALGKAYSMTDGDLATIFYNPAGTASLQGASVNTSFASPFYVFRQGHYDFISAGFNFNNYITLGLSRNHFTAGQAVNATNPSGNITSMGHTPINSIYTLNISVRVADDIFIGLNTNYLV